MGESKGLAMALTLFLLTAFTAFAGWSEWRERKREEREEIRRFGYAWWQPKPKRTVTKK